MKSFLVIGLGRFGESIARELSLLGNEVLALDMAPENIQHIADDVTSAIVGDARDEHVLRRVGARNFDCAIVSLASNLEASVLITLMLKDLGVRKIVAKAKSAAHARVLERIGADRVIQPESDMGQRLAHRLSATSNVVDFLGVSDDFSITELRAPGEWTGKTLGALSIRTRYSVNVLAIRNSETGHIDVTPAVDQIISKGDMLVIIGTNENVARVVELE